MTDATDAGRRNVSIISSDIEERILYDCIRCGFCKPFCPNVPAFDFSEMYSPRGKLLLMRGVVRGHLNLDSKIIGALYSCTMCGACYAKCPAGIEVNEYNLRTRHLIAGLPDRPPHIDKFTEALKSSGNALGMPNEERFSWMQDKTLFKKDADLTVWVGCMSSFRVPELGETLIKVMNALGVNYNIIEEEGCCANPLVWMGKTDEARKVAVETNMLFKRRKIGRLVTACAGCYHSFKEIWPKRLSVTPYPQVIHFSQFMDQLLSKGMVNFNKSLDSRVVYHDPCELGRHMGVYEEPRRVIRSIPGVKYFDTPYNRLDSKCCGGGGGTLPLYPEQDLKAAYSKLSSEVIPLQPNILVSSCPSCYITLKYAAESYDLNIEVIDLVQLVYRTL